MSAHPLLTCLKRGGSIDTPTDVNALMEEAARLNLPLEIRMELRPERFRGRFLTPPPDEEIPQHKGVLISPLEPALGNILIRSAPKVELQYALGIHALSGFCRFMEITPHGAQSALLLSPPEKLTLFAQRAHPRYRVPAGMIPRAIFNHLDAPCVVGDVEDLHMEGVSFLCCMQHAACDRDDLVRFSLETALPNMDSIKLTGKVCYRVRERRRDDLTRVGDRYGIRILNSNNYYALKRLVEVVKESAPMV